MVPPDDGRVPTAAHRRARWPGLVWAVPLAALIIVIYLGVQALMQRGVLVTVTFERAAGATPGETRVLYQGVEAGQLVKIVPNADGRRLDFKLRLLPEAKPGLNTNARFWLIGAAPNLSDLSSLKAAVEGVAVGYAPGEGGRPTRLFTGLEKAPIVLPGDRGTSYALQARSLSTIREGSELLYRGLPIGKVTDVRFLGEAGFRLGVFVFQPYDSLIKPGDRFWTSSPLQLSFGGGSVDTKLAPVSTILAGGIDLELPKSAADQSRSPAGSQFVLYPSQSAARQGLSGPAAHYDIDFAAAAGDLDEGSAVTLLGFQIGRVETARLAFDPHTGKPFTAVTALLFEQRLDAAGLRKLLQLGYRARLRQTPALFGARTIGLVPVAGAGAADLIREGSNLRIPSAPGATDVEEITARVDQILAKVDHIPLEQIGDNLAQVTTNLRRLSASPQLRDTLGQLDHTLTEIDRTFAAVQPQVGPLLSKLNRAADQISDTVRAAQQLLNGEGAAQDAGIPQTLRQLSDAARAVRTLTDYLERHPEALIRGKRPPK